MSFYKFTIINIYLLIHIKKTEVILHISIFNLFTFNKSRTTPFIYLYYLIFVTIIYFNGGQLLEREATNKE